MGFKAVHLTKIEQKDITEPGFDGVKVRWLITRGDGAENFAMRHFEISPGGESAHHSHSWEHETFILNGRGLVVCGDEERQVSPGFVVFIPPNVPHHFENLGDDEFRFLCLIPHRI
ncbi:cupin domain-containing protein [Candidatus Bathyarchaeota archaeon]|nr:cupin domain-containing protein [Candidatus Bathyarchaeota archaeon]NIU81618.1 cupin domain-containing protein [Candidatus Bathyarchaeota archaeon]NIV68263.1 cupin domain-containing protein [Candidatus Bathyarchaeota archaeon]NIW16604.1 cupin domain-containing protein [Candidatus Bathyarchaeota archaeon]NIW34804.1 cupin domain-containing protein [Candidatus Bathyarchaeota archaeon]